MYKKVRNRILLYISLGLALALTGYMIAGPSGFLRVFRLNQEKEVLYNQINKLQADNDQLNAQIDRLKTDNEYLEKVIREKLKLVKPEETIILFKSTPENGSGYR